MKNRLFLISVILALLIGVLSGCQVEHSVTASSSADGAAVPFPTGPAVALPALTDPDNYGLDLSVTDGWEVNYTTGNYGVLVEDGYYYVDDGFLRYLDLNTGVSVYLCSKVGCDHTDSSICESVVPIETSLYFWDDCLFYFERDAEGLQLLMRRDSTGMEKTKVATLGVSLLDEDQSVSLESAMLSDSWLYYTLAIQEIVRGENSVMITDGAMALCRVDLTNGKEEVLTTFDGGVLQLLTARSDAAIYMTCRTPELVTGEDGYPEPPDGHTEMLRTAPANLMRWDEATGESTTLLEATYSVLNVVKFYGGKAVFNTESGSRYSFDVETGEIEALASISGTIINENFMLYYDKDAENENQTIKNMQTGEQFSIELNASSLFRVYNRSDKWLILKGRNLFYIPVSAIADGIQAEDATAFPS